jgi:fructan beta-fructosidase
MVSTSVFAADDIVVADFEGKDYGEWKVEGEAFGQGPAKGTLSGQMHVSGFEGKRLVNTFLGGDKPKGKLTSAEFTIERDYIKFLIGGGAHQGQTCMNLLIDGKVILSATGPNKQSGGSEFLNWENWDVKQHKGQKAVLVIVDSATGGWGHINVDQIVQSDKKAKSKEIPARHGGGIVLRGTEFELPVTGKMLLLPCTGGRGGGHLTVKVGDQLVHNLKCTFAPNKDAVQWWGYLDMSEYQGKTAKLYVQAPEDVAKMIKFGDKLPNLLPLYDESLRPQLRISQMRGWNNDPNGMVYYDGEYHFFWQCNPAGNGWANMYWGHAVSKDLVHWTELPHALRNSGGREENRHPSMAVKNVFSGSANVDVKNTSGWQTGKEKVMIAAFTDTGAGESLAYSNDRGRTWTYHGPVIKHGGRDPKLIWYAYDKDDTPMSDEAKKLGGHWVIAVYDEKGGRNVAIYTSTNLKEWKEESHLHGYYECAELFELPVDGDKNNKKWVVFAADAKYVIGDFDGKTFTPDHQDKHQVHFGPYYASQCFSNTPDGRVIQVGWARLNMPGMPFNQAFTLPANLTLKKTAGGIRMYANPVKELEILRKPGAVEIKGKQLTAEAPSVSSEVKSDLVDVVLKVKKGTASKVRLQVGRFAATYDFNAQKVDGRPAPLEGGVATIRIVVDRPMHEIIGAGGASYLTAGGGSGGKPIGTVTVTAEGGTATIESLGIYEMKSGWKK